MLAASSESRLESISVKLSDANIAHTKVVESDDPYCGQLMAIGLELLRDRTQVQKVLSSLPLLRRSTYQKEAAAA